MAVAFDAVGPSSAGGGTANGSPSTSTSWSHTCSGTNRVVVVGVAVGVNPSGSVTTSVTYGGTAMTSVGKVGSNNNTLGYVQLFSLVNPPTGASTVAVSASVVTYISGGSISFTGASGVGTAVTAFGSSTTPTATVTGTASGGMVVSAACCGSPIASSAQTGRWLKNTNNNTAAGNGAGATAPAGGSVTMSHTVTSDWWGIVAVEVLAAASPVAPADPGLLVSRLRPYFG